MHKLAYNLGYICKNAEYDLPHSPYYKALSSGLVQHQAGRAQAMQKAIGKDPSLLIKYPFLFQLGAGSAGASIGLHAGALFGKDVLPKLEEHKYLKHIFPILSGSIGAIAGWYTGTTAINLAILRKVRQAKEEFFAGKIDKQTLRDTLEAHAEASPMLEAIKGLAIGPEQVGHMEQAANIVNPREHPEVGSGHVAGATELMPPIFNPMMGYQSVGIAQRAT